MRWQSTTVNGYKNQVSLTAGDGGMEMNMAAIPRVSVIMPSLNVGPYIEKCLESVLHQTMQDLQILCVDAGSTDGTLEILHRYEAQDSRVHVIISDKKSYGYQVNLGLDAAEGEYVGIVETDDFAEPDMFEKLYQAAAADDLDVCKAGFFFYWSDPSKADQAALERAGGPNAVKFWQQVCADEKDNAAKNGNAPVAAKNLTSGGLDVPYPLSSPVMAGRVFCPLTDFSSVMEQVDFFNLKPSIWSAIYRRSFLNKNEIRLNETPGASFQDTAFNFKVWALAGRVRLLTDCVLHYRQDNEQSSVNNPGKMFCLCDEYEVIDSFLDAHPELKGRLEGIKVRMKYDAYVWNCYRLDPSLRLEFLQRASEEFRRELEMGYADRSCFITYKWKAFLLIIQDPAKFMEKGLDGIWAVDIEFDGDAWFTKMLKKVNGGLYCVRDHGLAYTIKLGIDKIKDKKNQL